VFNKVLLRNKNGKYVYEVTNNNYNLPTYITSITRYIFHIMRLCTILHLVHWIQSAHFVCFGHKFRSLKMPFQTGGIYKTTKNTKAKHVYFATQHASTTCMYHEITTKSFTRFTSSFYVDYNLWYYLLQWQIDSTHNKFININSKKLKS